MVRRTAKRVNLEFLERGGGKVGTEGVYSGRNNNATLRMSQQHHFVHVRQQQRRLNRIVGGPDVAAHVPKVPLRHALQQIHDRPVRAVVNSNHRPPEYRRN
jgi:hypothetical protein